MTSRRNFALLFASVLALASLPSAMASPSPHGGEEEMGHMMSMNISFTSVEWSESFDKPNYFSHPGYRFWIWSHIVTMLIGWTVVLPVAIMFSIAKSRYSIFLNLAFLAVNGLGFFFGMIYNMSTPDLYENNAHHKIGWIFSIFALVWVILGFIRSFGLKSKTFKTSYQPIHQTEIEHGRWSDDSGRATLRNLSIGSVSPATEQDLQNFDNLQKESEEEEQVDETAPPSNSRVGRYVNKHVAKHLSSRVMWIIGFIYVLFERTLLFMSFVAITTGFVTFGGIFRGGQVFSGLAHFIKGGIFFWIGVLAIGRWAGAFADLGWAWNVKPPASAVGRRKFSMPSSEFVESCLIFVYGISNVWLEHLNATTWSPMDFEHVSITILFFGGGLLGMLIESRRVRNFLNMALTLAQPTAQQFQPSNTEATPEHATWISPLGTTTPMNPIPALTIMLLGLIMSAHTQHSALASTIHSYWGALFAFAAVGRMGTYVLHYLRPPVSYIPSRPPTELLAGFTLIAGGILFMNSPRDIIDVLDGYGGDAMVAFTVDMGLTATVSAAVVGCMAIKGWALSMENKRQLGQMQAQNVSNA